jgi:5,6,7,8-tetrahydromethanopterin hydro-lyase
MHEQSGTSPVLIGESFVGEGAEDLLLIATVWVDPAARDADLVYQNNRAATRAALQNGADGAPKVSDVLAARQAPANPFFSLG